MFSVIEKGESKSAVYRFCLHDDVYAFVNTQSKLFSNATISKLEFIMSTHTIVRLIDSAYDLNGNASTRLMKAIITSNRDLQKVKQQTSTNKSHSLSPSTTSTPPIGTQFALTMLGMHKNASDSLQQHVSSTLGTLLQVQNSLSAPTSTPNDKTQQQLSISSSSPPVSLRTNAQKSSTFDNVSSSNKVEFGSKRTSVSPSLNSVPSNHDRASSPANSFDLLFTSVSPSNDLNSFLPACSPTNKKPSSPLQSMDPSSLLFSNNDIYTTVSSPLTASANLSRSSRRLRQLLTTKSPSSTTAPSPHYRNDNKSHSNTFDDLIQVAESPTTTHVSPAPNDLPSQTKRSRSHSQTNGTLNNSNNAADMLLKQILGRQPSATTLPSTPNLSDIATLENNSTWPSPSSAPTIKTETNSNDDGTSPS
ncbi:unnamed protein product, partial [Rotaria magnacalcarata]